MTKKKQKIDLQRLTYAAFALLTIMLLLNQFQIVRVHAAMGADSALMPMSGMMSMSGPQDLSGVDVSGVESTAQGLAAVMALEGRSAEEVMSTMLPGGTPEYQQAMGISFDDPVGSLSSLAKAYPALKKEAKENDPEAYQRWLGLAAAPKGVSCEFCCGLGAQAIRADGGDMCGCQHHPALQSVTLWLLMNTDFSDAEVLREVYLWKTLFFPSDMVNLANQIAGGDESVLEDLPGMVGGC